MPPNSIKLSASQLDTANTCIRKWWLQKVAKLPRKFDRKLLLGSVGHEVLERYQLGQEMYPHDWTSPTNRFTGQKEPHHITTTEQALVKTLVNKAINENQVRREPDGEVEKEFGKELGVFCTVEGVKISFTGFIDYFYGNNIDDHKFTSAPRFYGNAKLRVALPMNLYAWAGYREGWLNSPTVWLRYNVFKKDTIKPEIKINHVERTLDEIEDYFIQHIEPLFKPMVLARKNCTSWEQVESAMCKGEADKACNKFGGCEFLDICLGKETLEGFRARFEQTNLKVTKEGQSDVLSRLLTGTPNPPDKGKKEKTMKKGFLSSMQKERGDASPAADKKDDKIEDAPSGVEAPKKAPWGFDACPVCANNGTETIGLSPDGTPCNICEITTNQLRETDPSQEILADYDVVAGTDGTVTWTKKGSDTPAVEEQVVQEPVVSEQVDQQGAAAFEPPPSATGTLSLLDAESKEGFVQERTGSRGFTLSFAPVRSRIKRSSRLGEANCVLSISELADMVGSRLLEIANKGGAAASCWRDVGYFTRRDLIAHNAKPIAELIGNSVVDASCMIEASDEHVICTAIERYASTLFGSFK